MAFGERQDSQQPVRRAGDAEGEQSPTKEADCQQAAARGRRHGARHDVVVGNGEDAADEGVEGPEREKECDGAPGAGPAAATTRAAARMPPTRPKAPRL